MPWFSKENKKAPVKQGQIAEGIWTKCESCGEIVYAAEIERNLQVCPLCDHHFHWPIRERLERILDPGSFEELDRDLSPVDPLGFSDTKRYRDRLKGARKKLGERDAFVSGLGRLDGHLVSVGGFDFKFMGGSMGSVVGEKVTRVFERAHDRGCAAIVFNASGGARMQEGIFSLMQMAKAAAAVSRFKRKRKPYISVMLHPTTGGVAASFAWLGDIIVAEPKALIGFAGPRVIEQTIRQKLPEGFQRSEFLVEKGMIDFVVHRKEMREKLALLLNLLG
ncbi:MAG: acetyl-CoA carboxylase carboxyltransferase subunit beta [Deltaproteobacteria bacterium]|nr:MAG: acetyl-CoA carboxylase carboxyltransferase subunit beta [Deltaproteobacteria bacterium]